MALFNRDTLKNYFKRGSFPTEVHFSDLIDSTVNKVDDGFAKDMNDGLQLSPQGSSKKLMSFYENVKDKSSAWNISLNPDSRSKGLSFADGEGNNALFLQNGGQVGIGTTTPHYELEVGGMVGMQGRIGTFLVGEAPADGKWHTLIDGLNHTHGFEVMAYASGLQTKGKYALTHAICLVTYGRSNSKIRQTRACYRWPWHRIRLRWTGSTYNYALQIKTGSHYGTDENELPYKIHYRVTKLWDERDTVINKPLNEQ